MNNDNKTYGNNSITNNNGTETYANQSITNIEGFGNQSVIIRNSTKAKGN